MLIVILLWGSVILLWGSGEVLGPVWSWSSDVSSDISSVMTWGHWWCSVSVVVFWWGRTDGRTDGQTEWNQYTPQQVRCAGGYNYDESLCYWSYRAIQMWDLHAEQCTCTITYMLDRYQLYLQIPICIFSPGLAWTFTIRRNAPWTHCLSAYAYCLICGSGWQDQTTIKADVAWIRRSLFHSELIGTQLNKNEQDCNSWHLKDFHENKDKLCIFYSTGQIMSSQV